MKLLLDTNIILDILLERSDFFNDALDMLEGAISRGDRLYLSSSAATDIYYIVRKNTKSKEKALDCIKSLNAILTFATVDEKCIISATQSKLNDYEDAVVEAVAKNLNVDYIITRDISHFKNSAKKAIIPTQYISLFESKAK